MRKAISNYTRDNHRPPQALQDLADAGYLREVPTDPVTERKDWVPILGDVEVGMKTTVRGLVDVHTNSPKLASNGTALNTW